MLYLFCLLLTVQVQNTGAEVIQWLGPTEYDFGDLPYKKEAYHTFRFKNVSGSPMVIDNVRPPCGCTSLEWQKTPIPADSLADIRIEYDARDKGYFRKSIRVFVSGQRKAEKLWIEGFVIAPDE